MTRALLWRVASRILAAIGQAGFLLIVAGSVGAATFGEFAVVLGVGTLSAALLGFGASSRILRIEGEADAGQLAGAFWVVRSVSAIVAFSLAFTVGAVAGFEVLAVAGAAALAASDAVLEYSQALLAGRLRETVSASLPVVQRVSFLVAAAAFVSTPELLFAAVIVVAVAWFGIGVVLTRSSVPGLGAVLASLRSSTGYWGNGLVANLKQLEPLAVSAVASPTFTGQFSLVARLVNPIQIVPASLQFVFVPRLASTFDQHDFRAQLRQLSTICIAYGCVVVVASPLAASLLPLLLGPDYADTFVIATATIAAAGLSSATFIFQIYFIARGKPWPVTWVNGLGGGLAVVLLVAVGAASGGDLIWVCPIIAQLCMLVGLWVLWRRDWSRWSM